MTGVILRSLCAVVLALGVAAQARAGDPDCDQAGVARVLRPAASADHAATAYWLDGITVRWPGHPEGRYRLLGSASGGLAAQVGERIRGADVIVPLEPAGRVPASIESTFRFTGPGVQLQVPAAARPRIAGLLRWQVWLVRVDGEERVIAATGIQLPGALDALYASADALSLGVQASSGAADFRLWAPTARRVHLCMYRDGKSPAQAARRMTFDGRTGAWLAHVPGNQRGRYYTYLVDVFVPGVGLVRNRVTDPYAISLSLDSGRSFIADLDDPALMPAGWRRASRPPPVGSNVDMAIYELHVRDFSARAMDVPPSHRGKYLAFTDADSAGMRHLRALRAAGITDIHLLPVFDFASVPEQACQAPQVPDAPADGSAQQAAVMAVAGRDCFNWGYEPWHFGAPEGSYATDAMDGAVRVREFRAMVQALHAAGLHVGMDVVYNHTTAAGQGTRSVLDRIVPGYYQRLDAKGDVATSTCCANTATEHRMMAKLMRDTLVRWARDYRIDSFRFDLMGHQPRDATVAAHAAVEHAAGRAIPFIGEGWNFGEVADGKRFVQAAQGHLDGTRIGTFSDRARDALRGGGCCDSGRTLIDAKGMLNGLAESGDAAALAHAAELARVGLAGTLRPEGYASQPGEVVNYVENHDNLTLYDLDALKLPPGTPSRVRAQVQLLGAAFVAFSQGIPYFHAGMDLLRSKSLDRNSFDSGDWFNRIDWSGQGNGFPGGLPPRPDNGKDWALLAPVLGDASVRPSPEDIAWTSAAFRDLLRIRRSTDLFRLRTAADVRRRLTFPNVGPGSDARVIVGHLDGVGLDGPFDEVLYLVNISALPRTIAIPQAMHKPWRLHPVQASAEAADARPREGARFDPATGTFLVPPRTALVYVIPRE